MRFDSEIYHRQSIRLQDYDYASVGCYFVTICVQGREPLLGEITDGEMVLNDAGRMVEHWWRKISEKFPTVELDHYMIMPNHFHGVLQITDLVGADPCVCPGSDAPEHPGGHTGPPLHVIIQWFKTMPTNAYIHGVNHHHWLPFPGRFWQRNYFERIIRDENELHHIRLKPGQPIVRNAVGAGPVPARG